MNWNYYKTMSNLVMNPYDVLMGHRYYDKNKKLFHKEHCKEQMKELLEGDLCDKMLLRAYLHRRGIEI